MKRHTRLPVLALILTLLAALACNATPTPDAAAIGAQTVNAVLTGSASAPTQGTTGTAPAGVPSETATPEGGQPPAETAQSKPSDTPGPTNTPGAQGCADDAQFVADVTVPDNTVFNPGAAFTKTWRLRNSGSCTWVSSYSLAFLSGDAMGGPASVAVIGNVSPGSQYEISVNLTAPASPGTYKGIWRMRNTGGAFFGTHDLAAGEEWGHGRERLCCPIPAAPARRRHRC